VHFSVCEKYRPSSLNGMHFAYFIMHLFFIIEDTSQVAKILDVIRRNAKSVQCSAAFNVFSGAGLNSEPKYSESEFWNMDDNSTKLVKFMLLYYQPLLAILKKKRCY
jgi:hypothetical protein